MLNGDAHQRALAPVSLTEGCDTLLKVACIDLLLDSHLDADWVFGRE